MERFLLPWSIVQPVRTAVQAKSSAHAFRLDVRASFKNGVFKGHRPKSTETNKRVCNCGKQLCTEQTSYRCLYHVCNCICTGRNFFRVTKYVKLKCSLGNETEYNFVQMLWEYVKFNSVVMKDMFSLASKRVHNWENFLLSYNKTEVVENTQICFQCKLFRLTFR